uniref:SEL-1-like domain containing protein n=1 Tax=uncultured organism TaxID=155900 RepID=A0A1B3SNZ0_9ZZZZ|nr:SEL-1-like domain containing protein [uncultured organism]
MKFFAWLVMFSLAAGVSLGAVAGDAGDCENYGLVGDYKRALPACSRAAKQGDVYAQYNLGVMYANGYGVPENDREAVKWYRLAAEQGLAAAQYN